MNEGEGAEIEKNGEEKDALDEWVDELDRLIGIEEMTEEEAAASNREKEEETRKGERYSRFIILALVIAIAVIAVLIYTRTV